MVLNKIVEKLKSNNETFKIKGCNLKLALV